jgi:hypothetical protein
LMGLAEAALAAAAGLGAGFLGLAVFLVAVTFGCSGASVTGWGFGMVVGVVALTTRPPRTTWLHPSPRSIWSAEGPACVVFEAAGLLAAVFLLPRTCARFALAAFACFHFIQHGSSL